MIEKWKTLEIMGLKYNISNTGKIVGLGRNKELKQRRNKDGYLMVTIGGENKGRTTKTVHSLVAIAFLIKPNNYEKFEVNHKDLNRENNRVNNLEWVTHQDNVLYSTKLGRYKGKIGELNPNYGNTVLKERFKEHPELTRILARPREQNGRCVKVKMIDMDNMEKYNFNFLGECAEFLKEHYKIKTDVNSLRVSISKRMKDGKLYKNKFKFTEG